MPHPKLLLLPPLKPKPKLMPTVDTGMADTDTAVDTDTVDTVMAVDTTEARGPLMPHPRLLLLPPLKPKPKLMPTVDTGMVDTDTAVDMDTVDTVDTTAVDTDTTEARGPLNLLLKPKPHPKLMLTTDTVDTAVDTVDTTAMDTDTVV